jgi:hypothetical protein
MEAHRRHLSTTATNGVKQDAPLDGWPPALLLVKKKIKDIQPVPAPARPHQDQTKPPPLLYGGCLPWGGAKWLQGGSPTPATGRLGVVGRACWGMRVVCEGWIVGRLNHAPCQNPIASASSLGVSGGMVESSRFRSPRDCPTSASRDPLWRSCL